MDSWLHFLNDSGSAYPQEMVLGARRALLASSYNNQADVTVQMIADSSTTVPDALTELNSSIGNGTLDVSTPNIKTCIGIHMTVCMYVKRLQCLL